MTILASWRHYISCQKWSTPSNYPSHQQMGLQHLQDLHLEEPRSHPSPPVWANSMPAIFLHPRFGLLIFLLLLFTDFTSVNHGQLPSHSGLLPYNTPTRMDLLPSIQTHMYFPPLFPLAPHITHYVTSSLQIPHFFLPFSFFLI